jgi:ribosomal protein S18 acetylase RimI-like enzyme
MARAIGRAMMPTVRRATPADITALHALVESAYRGDSARRGWTHEADLLGGQRTDAQALATHIADPDSAVLLGIEGADLIACVHLQRKQGGLAYLGLFAVSPGRQGGGIGKMLLAAAEDHAARVLGVERIEMTVIRQRTELIAWYERRGYACTGEERPFPLDDIRFGLPSTRDLAFAVLVKPLA